MLRLFSRDLRLFLITGALVALAWDGIRAVILNLYLASLKLIYGYRYQIGDRPLLMLAVLLLIIGVQFLMMGLLGEIVIRTYHEAQNKPIYFVRSIEVQSNALEEKSESDPGTRSEAKPSLRIRDS